MCTVSYIPVKDGFILTSNRDERPERPTLMPVAIPVGRKLSITAPQDRRFGGTWIATDGAGRTACLLNGAFENHVKQNSYSKSRGMLVLEAFQHYSFNAFIRESDFTGMEPFTLILAAVGQLEQLVWDGSREFYWELPVERPKLWSSRTLYSRQIHTDKETYFFQGIRAGWAGSAREILTLHGLEGHSPFLLEQPDIRTVSITQVRSYGQRSTLHHYPKINTYEKENFLTTVSAPMA